MHFDLLQLKIRYIVSSFIASFILHESCKILQVINVNDLNSSVDFWLFLARRVFNADNGGNKPDGSKIVPETPLEFDGESFGAIKNFLD